MRALAVSPCRGICTWAPTGATVGPARLALFACGGCGSEWVRTEAWTPVGAEGQVDAAVAAERAAGA